MKRALLIATGTVGGLGAVLAVTPPQFTSTQSSPMALPGSGTTPASTPSATTAATSTPSATAAATKSAKAKASKSAATGTKNSQTPAANTPAATPAKTTAAPAQASNSVSGTFTGDVVNVRYGNVQVKITVENGKITDAQAVQAPSGRNDRWTQMAVPILRQQTLKAQSGNISGVSGASFTSYGWYTSLASALAKAGM